MKVVATLACRVQSKRLYAKPLQLIDVASDVSILEYLVNFLKTCRGIDEIVLAISEGEENMPFKIMAKKLGLTYIVGDEIDVQGRLIKAVESLQGDTIYRVTTECPFIYMDNFKDVLDRHQQNKASLTVIEGLPEGVYYELIDVEDLKRAHDKGLEKHRSELCSLYMFENPKDFRIQKLTVDSPQLQRPDIRLTVDYPEDLIVVRELYKALKKEGQFVSIAEIIDYLDSHPKLNELNNWIDRGKGRIWD